MFSRFIKESLYEALDYMPVVFLRGARQTGKTTVAKSFSHDRTYLTFDHLPTLVTAREDPVGFISRIQKPVILDEIQRVPELFLPIKSDVDENRLPGRYLLTGSVDPLLIPKLGDSLAGRMRLLTLWPLSQGEIRGTKETFLNRIFNDSPLQTGFSEECSKKLIVDLAIKGGYPAPFQMNSTRQANHWFNDYVTLVLQKDILDLSRIENINQMPHLLMLLATRVGGLLNNEELARSLKLNSVTLNRYLELLRTLFLVHFIPAWSGNLGKRLVKSPKVYLNDTALQLFLLNIDRERLERDSHLIGKMIENFVILEIAKQMSWSDLYVQIFHYRDYNHTEVDLILEGPGGDLVAIEIKSSESISREDTKGLNSFIQSTGGRCKKGILLYAGNTHLPMGEQITAMPISTLWN